MEEKNIRKINQSYITPDDSLCIYGVAILMMVWHHFFGFPERFHGSLQYMGGNIEYTIELYLGYFCRLCIAMYAFISGYGMMAKSMQKHLTFLQDIKQAIKQIINFFIRYWIVFIVFILIGLKIGALRFSVVEFMKNLIGQSCSYNAEWWYVAYYIKMIISYPFIKWLFRKLDDIGIRSWIIALVMIVLTIANAFYHGNLTYYLCFWIGMLTYQSGFYSKISEKLCVNKIGSVVILIGCTILSIIIRIRLPYDIDALLVIIYIYGILQFLKNMKNVQSIRRILQMFGKYSIYIWLTHTFFLYYYFQTQLMYLKNVGLIYIFTLCICLAVGMILNKIYLKLNKGLKWKRKEL